MPVTICIQNLCSDIDEMVFWALSVENATVDDDNVEDDLIALDKTIVNLQMHAYAIRSGYGLLLDCDEVGLALQAQIHKFAEDYKAYPELLYEQLHIMHYCDTRACLDSVSLSKKKRAKLKLDIEENGYND